MHNHNQQRSFGYQYRDILALLDQHDYNATVTDTGGGCLALVFKPLTTRTVLITDKDGPLEVWRADQTGWGVGVYDDLGEQRRYRDTSDCSVEGLLELLDEVK